jgi:multidrug resistance efflux pump
MTLTPEQLRAIQSGQPVSVTVDQTECVVVRTGVLQKIRQVSYDDSDWSDEEMEAVAAQTFDALDDAERIE